MATDVRSFIVDTVDDAHLWAVLAAVETASHNTESPGGRRADEDDSECVKHVGATRRTIGIETSISVRHASGWFSRASVGAARSTAERNGSEPSVILMSVDETHEFFDREDASPDHWSEDWIKCDYRAATRQLEVEVKYGTEVEVNGVFNILKDAVNSATRARADAMGSGVVAVDDANPGTAMKLTLAAKPPWWRRLRDHPWFVGIATGVIVTVGAAIAAGLI
jgi:hypothetical protein